MSSEEKNCFILLPLLYIIPSLLLYMMELIVMRFTKTKKQFDAYFYNIFAIYSVNNIICSIMYFICYRGVAAPALSGFYQIFPEEGFIISVILYFCYCSGAAQVVLDVCICFNRFTVVLLENKYTTFWNKFGNVVVVIHMVIPFLLNWETFFFKPKLTPANPLDLSKGFSWGVTDSSFAPWMNRRWLIVGNVVISSTLSFCMNLYVCSYIMKQRMNVNKTGGKIFKGHDFGLFIFNLFVFLTQCVQFILQMIFLFSSPSSTAVIFAQNIQFFVMDINTLIPAWFFFIMSRPLRTSVLKTFFNVGKTEVSHITLGNSKGRIQNPAVNNIRITIFTKTTSNIHPEIIEYNTKVYAEFFGEDAELDYLTDDDIRKIEYSNGFEIDGSDKSIQWPNGIIPYYLDSAKFDDRFLTEFYGALDEFHSKTCVHFRPKTNNDKNFVKIIRGDGCWSYVGMQPELMNFGQELSLGDECWRKGIIIHELTHALGFFHEHSRFDRDAYVFLNTSNIQKNRIRQFDKRPKELVDEIGPYDLYSIMHYEQNAFAVDKRSPTIIPKIKGARISEMGQRIALSPVDVSKIRMLYNCSDSSFKKVDLGHFKSFKTSEPNYQNGIINKGRYNGNTVTMKQQLPLIARIRHRVTPFKNFEDFTTRTGMKEIPIGFNFEFLNKTRIQNITDKSSFKMYPNTVNSGQRSGIETQCPLYPTANCLDSLIECPKLASEGLCEKKPGMMLIHCKRSCCNCNNTKCFDTTDQQKFNTLCAARNSEISPCSNPATKQNAREFCPLTCQVCVPNAMT